MIRETMWPLMTRNITPAATKKIVTQVAAYVDWNSSTLLTLDMSTRYSFADKDREVIYSAVGITPAEVEDLVRQSKFIYQSNKIHSNPFYITSTLLTAWYLKKNDEKMAVMVWTYMSLNMLTSIHKGVFPYPPNREIWDYTLSHIDHTFSIINFPSIFAFIQDNSTTVINTYKTMLTRGDDKDLTYVIDANWTRLKGKMKKIAARYYDNHKSGRYLNRDTDSFGEDNFHQMDNVSFAADRLVNKVYIKLVNHQFDRRFIKYSMSGSDVSYNKVLHLVEDIIDEDGEDGNLKDAIDKLIKFYLNTSGKPMSYIGKGDFVVYMKTAFGSNTLTREMIEVKETIDQWLKEHMYKYGRANYGKTVQITYRRVIFMFLVFVINYEAKLQ